MILKQACTLFWLSSSEFLPWAYLSYAVGTLFEPRVKVLRINEPKQRMSEREARETLPKKGRVHLKISRIRWDFWIFFCGVFCEMNPSKEMSNTPKIVGTYVGKREERLGDWKSWKTFKTKWVLHAWLLSWVWWHGNVICPIWSKLILKIHYCWEGKFLNLNY